MSSGKNEQTVVTDLDALDKNIKRIQDPSIRQALYKQFAPTFYFAPAETNFPANIEDYVRNVVEVKYDEYTHIKERQGRELTLIEKFELQAIKDFFLDKDNKFNPNYKTHQNKPEFQALTNRDLFIQVIAEYKYNTWTKSIQDNILLTESEQLEYDLIIKHCIQDDTFQWNKSALEPLKSFFPVSRPGFLIFDEKHYGYKLGEKIDVIGVAPKGHPEYDSLKPTAELPASIVATQEGYYIQYDYFYPLNGAIPGLQWLRELVPEGLSQRVDDFGLHYGDCEGVAIHVKVDQNTGEASFDFMQTFAHGAKGARIVYEQDCSFDENGHPCVYVGEAGHPSYADNSVTRTKFADRVGDKYKIQPDHFVDVTRDVIEMATNLTNHDQPGRVEEYNQKIKETAEKLPAPYSSFCRFADSNPLANSGPTDDAGVKKHLLERNKYTPFLWLTKTWNQLNNIQKGQPAAPYKIPIVDNLPDDTSKKPPSRKKISQVDKDYGRILAKLGQHVPQNTSEEKIKDSLEKKHTDYNEKFLFGTISSYDQKQLNCIDLVKLTNIIRTTFTGVMADRMVDRLTANDLKGQKFFNSLRLVEQSYEQIINYLQSNKSTLHDVKLLDVGNRRNKYRQDVYQCIFKMLEQHKKPTKSQCSKEISAINDAHFKGLKEDSYPSLRKLLMVMINALAVILTAGTANLANNAMSGQYLFFSQPKSKELIDEMTHQVSSKMTKR